MASITSLSNSSYNASSIYGNRNVLSGLASGMDTESMIENAVSGIKTKIQNLYKKRTKIEWQQEAYRSIIDKAVNFSTKYTSYSSKTNLLSSSFFNNAVNTVAKGTFASKVTASGKTSSDIKINAVKQMATAATYTVSGLGGNASGEIQSLTGGETFDLNKQLDVSTISGSLTFQYGGSNGASFDISFDELEDWSQYEGNTDTEKLANAINKKLSEISYSYTKNGFQETTTADKAIKVKVDGMNISFEDGLGNGNKVSISSVSGDIEDTLGISAEDEQISLSYDTVLTKQASTSEYLKNKELSINFNGTTKKISMNKVFERMGSGMDETQNVRFQVALQEELDSAFGAGKIDVARSQDGKLSFTPKGAGNTVSVGGSAVKALGFESGDANYINTGKKLSDLMGDDIFADKNKLAAVGSIRQSSNGKYSVDEAGNRVSRGDDGKYYRVNSDGEFLYDFKINGANINVTKDTTLESLMNSINSNAEAGVKVSYSKLTNEFKFTATETGANSKVEFDGLAKEMFGDPKGTSVNGTDKVTDLLGTANIGSGNNFSMKIDGKDFTMQVDQNDTMDNVMEKIGVLLTWENGGDPNSGLDYKASLDPETNRLKITDAAGKEIDYSFENGLAKDLFNKIGNRYTAGQDAIMDVEINGKRFENFTRSSNSFDIDGLTVNVKGTFNVDGANAPDKDGNEYEPITFETSTDSDKIVDAIRDFVNDYNEMITELKGAYSTLPAQQTNGSRYEPLTAEQEDGMTESEIKSYNEKAKQGILFGDSTLSSMYSKLLSAITPGGADGQTLREIGIGTSYNNGLTTIDLDEDKLRAALESDPDKVRNAFTKTREGGSSSDGLMQTMQNTLNTYVKTTGEPKGVLIQRAGSVKAYTSLNNNSLKSQMDSIDSQIERWQNKMSTQIDRYTSKFSKLEQLIAQMNSQASAMAGLMGGDSGY